MAQALPGAGARLERVVRRGPGARSPVTHQPAVVEDRLEVALGEAARFGREGQRFLDRDGTDEGGKLGRPAHLGPDPLGARGRRKDQPALGTLAEPEERGLLRAHCPGLRVERVGGPLGIVGGIDPRVAGCRERMAGDLAGSGRSLVDDHELVAVDAHPDPLADELVGHPVAGGAEADRRLVVDDPGQPEGDRVRRDGHGVEPAALLGEQVGRRPPGLAMRALVDLGAERGAADPERGEGRVRLEQVGVGRDEVGLGDLDRALGAALGRGVGRHAGMDDEAIVAGGSDEDRVLHRDPGHPVDRDGPLVVGQGIGGRTAEPAKGLVETRDHRRQRPVPGRDDHPISAPGEPGAPEQAVAPGDHGALAPVELEPHAGLGDPGPEDAPVPRRVRVLDVGHRTPRGPLRAVEAERAQLLVGDVGADPAMGALDPLLELGEVRVEDLVAAHRVGGDRPRSRSRT